MTLRRQVSRIVGWLADRRIPGPLRPLLYRAYARVTGADPSEAQLPLAGYPSLGAFFVRRLKPGARTIDPTASRLISPCDGTLQAHGRVSADTLLQAKNQDYSVRELLAGAEGELELDGAWSATIYLGPKDYHRVHAPLAGELVDVRWVPGDRSSVAPSILARRPRVLATNERAVLRFETERGPYLLVMVGAFNVGRIRVVGIEPGTSPETPKRFERGEELARFELGSTVVLVFPNGLAAPGVDGDTLAIGTPFRLGEAIGTLAE